MGNENKPATSTGTLPEPSAMDVEQEPLPEATISKQVPMEFPLPAPCYCFPRKSQLNVRAWTIQRITPDWFRIRPS